MIVYWIDWELLFGMGGLVIVYKIIINWSWRYMVLCIVIINMEWKEK